MIGVEKAAPRQWKLRGEARREERRQQTRSMDVGEEELCRASAYWVIRVKGGCYRGPKGRGEGTVAQESWGVPFGVFCDL